MAKKKEAEKPGLEQLFDSPVMKFLKGVADKQNAEREKEKKRDEAEQKRSKKR